MCLRTSQNASHCVNPIIAMGPRRSLSENEVLLKWVTWTQSTREFHIQEFKENLFPLSTLLRTPITNINVIFTSVFSNSSICLFESLSEISVQMGKLLNSAIFVFKVCVKLFLQQKYNKWEPTRNHTGCTDVHRRNLSPRNESRFPNRQSWAVVSVKSSVKFWKQSIWWFPRETAQPQYLSIFKDYHSGLLNRALCFH